MRPLPFQLHLLPKESEIEREREREREITKSTDGFKGFLGK